jgi:hypothetical protein
VGPEECFDYRLDGTVAPWDIIPHGGSVVAGKLAAAEDFARSREFLVRERRLEKFVKANTGGGYLLGDVMKGGHPASPLELILYRGMQQDVPRGLERCSSCSEWQGECLDPNPLFQGHVVPVHCRCENNNRCARCGELLHDRRLNGNYYDEEDGQVWHVPGFCGLSHQCRRAA